MLRAWGRWAAAGLCAGVALLPWPLDAATTATFQVSATVTSGCLVVGGGSNYGALNFGTFAALATGTVTAQLSANPVTLQCTPGITLSMQVGGG